MTDLKSYLRGVLDELEGEPIPFQLHGHIRALTEICETLMEAVEFYARSRHIEDLKNDLENPSGEPENWVCDSDDKFNLENGGIARQAKVRVGEILEGKK